MRRVPLPILYRSASAPLKPLNNFLCTSHAKNQATAHAGRADLPAPNPMVGEQYRRLTSDGEALTACQRSMQRGFASVQVAELSTNMRVATTRSEI